MYITKRFERAYMNTLFFIKEGELDIAELCCEECELEAITPNMTAIAQGLRDYLEGDFEGDTTLYV